MNFSDPTWVAGYIMVGGSAFLTMIIRARKMWIRDARDIQYDEGQTQWVKDLQAEVGTLRKEKEQLWKEKIEDIRIIEQCRASDIILRGELERMKHTIAALENSTSALKTRVQTIDTVMVDAKIIGK